MMMMNIPIIKFNDNKLIIPIDKPNDKKKSRRMDKNVFIPISSFIFFMGLRTSEPNTNGFDHRFCCCCCFC